MATTINADDGAISGSAGLKSTADASGILALQTNGTTVQTITSNGVVVSVSSASDAFRITQTGAGNALLVEDSANPDSSPFTITAAGEVLVGSTTPITDSGGTLGLIVANNAPSLNLFRNDTSVVLNDSLGSVTFYGNDTTGNTVTPLASIAGVASGTHAAGDNPTDLVFSITPDGTDVITEAARITNSGDLKFNSGYGSVAVGYGCRAWVSFDGVAAGTFPGGTSTVTRVAGSSVATVTTTTAHGLLTGATVQALTGVVAGTYVVTGTATPTTFTFTTAATTALTNASITFAVSNIYADGNVSSIADIAVGRFAVNFVTAFPDANYVMAGSSGNLSGVTTAARSVARDGAWTTGSALIRNMSSSGTASDDTYIGVAFFR
jgi:hypothetical protein